MIPMIWFGLRDLLNQWKLALAMSLVAAVALLFYLILVGFQNGLQTQFGKLDRSLLTVQEMGSFGEVYGSHLSAKVGVRLQQLGASIVVPEIHDVIGTSMEDALLLRGVDLNQYDKVENFRLVSGRALGPGDLPRSAMIGYRLADNKNLTAGKTISLRGRDFNVIGIFRTDTYTDNEAWISLQDAQTLLGWGSDVSVYIIEEGGPIKVGDSLDGGATAAVRGESVQSLSSEYQPVIDDHGAAAQVMGLVTALTLANVLLRLALIRRRDLSILRTVGFQRRSLIIYLGIQALAIAGGGALLAGLGTLALTSILQLGVFGFEIRPIFDSSTLIKSALWFGLITSAGTILSVWTINRLNLARLLRTE
jgi:putative ABC transport system permease protein